MQFIKETYNIKRGYRILFGQSQVPKLGWSVMVWERISIPKQQFILWLVIMEKLRTRDNLYKIGVVGDKSCLLFKHDEEATQHLFF